MQGGGLQLRGPIAAVFRYPTVVLFCEGEGIAAAAALIEAGTDPSGLSLTRRPDVRMYYRVSPPASRSRRLAGSCVLQLADVAAECRHGGDEHTPVALPACQCLLLLVLSMARGRRRAGAQRGGAVLPGAVRGVGAAVQRPRHHLHPRLLLRHV